MLNATNDNILLYFSREQDQNTFSIYKMDIFPALIFVCACLLVSGKKAEEVSLVFSLCFRKQNYYNILYSVLCDTIARTFAKLSFLGVFSSRKY